MNSDRKIRVRTLCRLAIPAFVENVINALFGIVDTAMLKKTSASALYIAAIGSTGALNNLTKCVVTFFLIGLTVVVSQHYGRGEKEFCSKITAKIFPFAAAVGVILSVLCSIFSLNIVDFLTENKEIVPHAAEYYRIISLGYTALVIKALATAALRGVGISTIPMIYNLFSGALNVGLNWCLIGGHLGFPALELRGAAIATVMSESAAAVIALCMLLFAKTPVRILGVHPLKNNRAGIRDFMKLGSSSAAEQLVLQIGAVITSTVISRLSTLSMAAYHVNQSVDAIAWAIGGAFCAASTTMSGMSFGRGDTGEVRKSTCLTLGAAYAVGAAASIAYIVFGRQIASFYTDEPEVIDLAARALAVSAFTLFGIVTHQTIAGSMRGIGRPRSPLLASLISLWVFRVLGCYLCVVRLNLGVLAVVACVLADQWVRGLINVILWIRAMRKTETADKHRITDLQ